ncbi:MAG: amidinotransferase [Thermoanaerobaculia bacterium]
MQPIEQLSPIVSSPVVSSYNEWDPLEEVIVGVADGACIPAWHVALKATMPRQYWGFFAENGGKPFPQEVIDRANRDLDGFVRLLEAEGVTVRRPETVNYSRPFATPHWQSPSGLYAAMPRDTLLVVGDEIIEAPMAWRSRYHEIAAYRPLLREYFLQGARWTAAPKPQLRDELYRQDYEESGEDLDIEYVIGEDEPTFDAADFIRCGADLFAQQSHVTNDLGIQWLERHLGPGYRVHRVRTRDSHPMHIDATMMPLAPGKLLVNPERVPEIHPLFESWEVRRAPEPYSREDHMLCSAWVSMNFLSLDERRVIVERHEEATIRELKRWGFEVLTCEFRGFNLLGGSFHCATLDVRRRGDLESYF